MSEIGTVETGRRRDAGGAWPEPALATALAMGALFAVLTWAVTSGLTVTSDTRAILALESGHLPRLIPLMVAASWLASGAAIPLAVLTAVVLRRRSGGICARLYIVSCLTGWALNLVLKELTHRQRPHGISPKLTAAGFYSFPSGHAMMALLVFGFGAVLLARSVRRIALRRVIVGAGALLTALVAVSRVFLGAHWPTDVVGGVVAGIGWAAVCMIASRRWSSAPE